MKMKYSSNGDFVYCDVESHGGGLIIQNEYRSKNKEMFHVTLFNYEILFTGRYMTVTGFVLDGANKYTLTSYDLYPTNAQKI